MIPNISLPSSEVSDVVGGVRRTGRFPGNEMETTMNTEISLTVTATDKSAEDQVLDITREAIEGCRTLRLIAHKGIPLSERELNRIVWAAKTLHEAAQGLMKGR